MKNAGEAQRPSGVLKDLEAKSLPEITVAWRVKRFGDKRP
jgi:hypothetical protein